MFRASAYVHGNSACKGKPPQTVCEMQYAGRSKSPQWQPSIDMARSLKPDTPTTTTASHYQIAATDTDRRKTTASPDSYPESDPLAAFASDYSLTSGSAVHIRGSLLHASPQLALPVFSTCSTDRTSVLTARTNAQSPSSVSVKDSLRSPIHLEGTSYPQHPQIRQLFALRPSHEPQPIDASFVDTEIHITASAKSARTFNTTSTLLASPSSSLSSSSSVLSTPLFGEGFQVDISPTADLSIRAMNIDPERKQLLRLLESDSHSDNVEGMKKLIQMIHTEMLPGHVRRATMQNTGQAPNEHETHAAEQFSGCTGMQQSTAQSSISSQLVLGGVRMWTPRHSDGEPKHATEHGTNRSPFSSPNLVEIKCDRRLDGEWTPSTAATTDRAGGILVLDDSDNNSFARRLQLAVLSFFVQPDSSGGITGEGTDVNDVDTGSNTASPDGTRRCPGLMSYDVMCHATPTQHRQRNPLSTGKHEGRLQLASMRAILSALQHYTTVTSSCRLRLKQRSSSYERQPSPQRAPSVGHIIVQSKFWTGILEWSVRVVAALNDGTETSSPSSSSLPAPAPSRSLTGMAGFVCQCLRLLLTLEKRMHSFAGTMHRNESESDRTVLQRARRSVLPLIANGRIGDDGSGTRGGDVLSRRKQPCDRMLSREVDRLLKAMGYYRQSHEPPARMRR